ncbi:unnamed protein product [Parnassius apollo]|uniref:(apollo) hypothetical protein n=1 Tax=Parnassius apollo TaxID=110799 RepID=A0A8S3WTQ3_PARAO|nr:unnamed protein product [Parnassius apollo]
MHQHVLATAFADAAAKWRVARPAVDAVCDTQPCGGTTKHNSHCARRVWLSLPRQPTLPVNSPSQTQPQTQIHNSVF